jgi:hypothetical protein
MNRLFALIAFIILLATAAIAILAASYHRVVVVEGISGTPLPGAYISIQNAAGSPIEIGQTDANGKLTFWTSPLPVPQLICAQSTFYAMGCESAVSLDRHVIELAVPAVSP